MIRTTSHSLKFVTDFKKSKLDDLFSEYQIVTNKFVNLFWNGKKLPSKPNKDQWRIEKLIQKVKQKKTGSLNQKKAVKEVKDYISKCVNELQLDGLSCIVIEDIKQSKMMKRGKSSKQHRKTLSNWYHNLFVGRLSGRCEMNRVHLATINPAYTSQKYSQCGEIHSESRVGELYSCKSCGLKLDADYNASLNIKQLFLSKEHTVPNDIKSCISLYNLCI